MVTHRKRSIGSIAALLVVLLALGIPAAADSNSHDTSNTQNTANDSDKKRDESDADHDNGYGNDDKEFKDKEKNNEKGSDRERDESDADHDNGYGNDDKEDKNKDKHSTDTADDLPVDDASDIEPTEAPVDDAIDETIKTDAIDETDADDTAGIDEPTEDIADPEADQPLNEQSTHADPDPDTDVDTDTVDEEAKPDDDLADEASDRASTSSDDEAAEDIALSVDDSTEEILSTGGSVETSEQVAAESPAAESVTPTDQDNSVNDKAAADESAGEPSSKESRDESDEDHDNGFGNDDKEMKDKIKATDGGNSENEPILAPVPDEPTDTNPPSVETPVTPGPTEPAAVQVALDQPTANTPSRAALPSDDDLEISGLPAADGDDSEVVGPHPTVIALIASDRVSMPATRPATLPENVDTAVGSVLTPLGRMLLPPAGVAMVELLAATDTTLLTLASDESVTEAAQQAAGLVAVPAAALTALTLLGWALQPAATKASALLLHRLG